MTSSRREDDQFLVILRCCHVYMIINIQHKLVEIRRPFLVKKFAPKLTHSWLNFEMTTGKFKVTPNYKIS